MALLPLIVIVFYGLPQVQAFDSDSQRVKELANRWAVEVYEKRHENPEFMRSESLRTRPSS